MKKINDLKEERTQEVLRYNELADMEKRSEDQERELDEVAKNITSLDREISILERKEELNKKLSEKEEVEERTENVSLSVQFRDFLKEAVNGKGPMEFRADPILTSTDTGVINKIASPGGIDVLTSPGEQFLRDLGITFYEGLNGNLTLSSMAEDTAAFVAEDASAASADMSPSSLTLAARRVTHTQTVTRELLSQSNPQVFQSVLQNLMDGLWNAIRNDVFDTLEGDAATAITTKAAQITYQDVLNLEASTGGLDLRSPAYVAQSQTKAFLKQLATVSSVAGPAWDGNEMNGYPAWGTPGANTERVYFGDWSRVAIAVFGENAPAMEIIVDPYTDAKKGEIHLTAAKLVDTGCYNPRAFSIYADASTY